MSAAPLGGTPEVSILLPARDAADTLPLTLRSLTRQTFGDWECVAIDDGSRDATLTVLRDAALHEPRLRIVAGAGAGIVQALNRGLEFCRGRFVARMDADDVMHPERLRLQRQALLSAPELAGVGCHVRLFPRRRLSQGILDYEAWLNSLTSEADVLRDRFVECPLAHPSFFLRAEALRAAPYRDAGWAEDYDLVLRLLGRGARLAVVPKPLLFWRDHPGRLSRTHAAYAQSQFVACKAHFIAASYLAGHERYVLWGYGDTGRTLSRALLEHGKRPSHIVERHPGRVGQVILGARVIPPSALPALAPRPERIVVSVAGAEARGLIRGNLGDFGFSEGSDFICAA